MKSVAGSNFKYTHTPSEIIKEPKVAKNLNWVKIRLK